MTLPEADPPGAVNTQPVWLRYGWLLLLGVTALLYLPGIAELPLMDRDEPRFAHATVEMMQRGSWAVPYFNGEYRFDKPPLTYWWMSLHYRLFGISETAARLHTTISVWLVALVTAGIGRRLRDARAGLLAALAWLLTLQVLVHGRLCVADMPLVLCITLALRALIELLGSGSGARPGFTGWHWLLYASMGCGFLAKGPLAFLVPGLALILLRWAFWRKPMPWAQLKMGSGLLISLIIAAVWGVPALIETKGLFWKVGMGGHVLDRGTKAFNGRFTVPGYYLGTAFLSLFPWIALLPGWWRGVRRQWSFDHALLVSWFAAPYVIFTFYATQLPHYVMPGFPAAMLLAALSDRPQLRARWERIWCFACPGLFAALGITVLLLRSNLPWPEPLKPLLLHGAVLLVLLAALGWCVVRLLTGSGGRSWLAGMAAAVFGTAILFHQIGADIRFVHPAVRLAGLHRQNLSRDMELIGWQFTEPSLVFQFNRQWRFATKLEKVEKMMSRSGPRLVVLLEKQWTLSHALKQWMAGKDLAAMPPAEDLSGQVSALASRHPDYQRTELVAFNAARSSWVRLAVLLRPDNSAAVSEK